MRALLIGAGGMGQAWARNIRDNSNVELDAWIDVVDGAAAQATERNQIEVNFTGSDFQRAIIERRPDFVVDVTPPEVHRDVTVFALDHGAPVLGEKPMSTSMDDARAMVAAADRSGLLYMVSQSRRYNNHMHAFRQLVADSCGEVGLINADFFIGAHFGGFRDTMAHVLLADMAIHTFDQARYLTGLDPVSVYTEEFNPKWSWYRDGAGAQCWFEMSNGAMFNYRGCWCADGLPSSWDADWRIVGERGTAKWERNEEPFAETLAKAGGFHSEMRPVSSAAFHEPEGIAGSLSEFVHALQTGIRPANGECHDNIKSYAMVAAAIESSRQGRRVQIDEI